MKIKYFSILVTLLLFVSVCGCNAPNTSTFSPITDAPALTSTPTFDITAPPTITPAPTATPLPTSTPIPPDTEAPELTLLGDSVMKVIARSEFTEPGFTAVDNRDGDLTGNVQISGTLDVNLCGTYDLTYEVIDKAGNHTTATRTVEVAQPEIIIPDGKIIYLTFDDGPASYTDDLLALLEKYNVKVTFFTCDTGHPELIKQIYDAGHAIGLHCRRHVYEELYVSEEAYFNDLFAIQDIVFEATGTRPTMIRFPGGSSNLVSSYNPGIMTRLTKQVEQMGFQYFDWNVSSGDAGGTTDTKQIIENVTNEVQKHTQYSIVLLHSEYKSYSFDAIEEIIVWGLENGYTFLPLDPTSPRSYHRVKN